MRRLKKLLVVALLAVVLLPSRAYASTFICSTELYVNDADVAACKYFGQDFLTMDSGLRSLLSQSTAGGGEGTTSSPNYPWYATFRGSLYSREISIGSPISGGALAGSLRWYSSRDGAIFVDTADKARADLAKALRWWQANKEGIESSGGSGGGGGGDDEVGQLLPVPSSIVLECISDTSKPNITVTKSDNFEYVSTYAQEAGYSYWVAMLGRTQNLSGNPRSITTFAIYFFKNRPILAEQTFNSGRRFRLILQSGSGYYYASTDMSSSVTSALESGQQTALQLGSIADGTYPNAVATGWMSNVVYISRGTVGGGGHYEPVEPDPLPPKNPDAPSNPVVPTPPEPGDPVPGPDVDVDPVVNVTYTVTQQSQNYQNIIDAISVVNENIKVISNNLVTLESNLQAEFNGLYDQLTNNFQAFMAQHEAWWQWYYEAWGDYTQQIDDWGNWLSETLEDMRADFESFGTRLDTWLEMIYNRIAKGGGPVSKPDPVDDVDGFWEWWNNILQRLIGSLPEAVTDFLNQLNRLKGVFPFSIPWDVGFILGLFSQPAATPVFDIDMSTHYWEWQARIDLHQWDNVAAIFRRCVLLVFAVQLAMWTPDVVRNLVNV